MMIGMQHHSIISREIIKPSSPTPSHLNTYNLSMIDQYCTENSYLPILLFYPNDGNSSLSAHDKARQLKTSLSHSLTQYYPFAGRLTTSTTPYVDCNDEGVVFVEAIIDSQMETFQHMNEDDGTIVQLFADGFVGPISPFSPTIVTVQVNNFSCGGMAVAVSISHRIADGCTLGSFLNHWSSVARYGSDHKEVLALKPHFLQSPRIISTLPEAPAKEQRYPSRVMRKFVFPNTKLSDLKNKVIALASAGSTSSINNPTRVEMLMSLLYKTAMTAATTKSGCFKPSNLIMTVNMRGKFVQKLPQTTFGNLLSAIMISTRHETESSLNVTVAEIKKEKSQLDQGVQNVQHAAENFISVFTKFANKDLDDVATNFYVFSSLCGFPYNKVDFGWGKPKVSTLPVRSVDLDAFILKDTPDRDGVEALVFLEKENMEIFQNDKEMLSFCQ